jgi:hypothetical protein
MKWVDAVHSSIPWAPSLGVRLPCELCVVSLESTRIGWINVRTVSWLTNQNNIITLNQLASFPSATIGSSLYDVRRIMIT